MQKTSSTKSEKRAESTEYYLGNEPEATSTLQSEFISTDVRDTVLFMLPNIMRTFFGTKKVVEFVPNGLKIFPSRATNRLHQLHRSTKESGFQCFVLCI